MAGELGIGMIGKEELPALGGQVLNHKPLEGAGAGGSVPAVSKKGGEGSWEGIFWRSGFWKTNLVLELQRNWDTERSLIGVGRVPHRQPQLPDPKRVTTSNRDSRTAFLNLTCSSKRRMDYYI